MSGQGFARAGVLALWLFVAAMSFQAVVPLTYDEAWNFLNISSESPLWVVSHYPFANNHILFSLLQSSLLPAGVVDAWPPMVRALNVMTAGALFSLFERVLRAQNVTPLNRFLLLFGVMFCSPAVTTYFFVARGYLLANALLMLSLIAATDGRVKTSALLAALSVYCLPTYAFAVPGIPSVFLTRGDISAREKLKAVVAFGCVAATVTIAVYWPVHAELARQTSSFWPYPTWTAALNDIARVSTNFAVPGLGAVLFLTTLALLVFARAEFQSTAFRFGVGCWIASLAQLGVSAAGAAQERFPFPFIRSVQPVILLQFVAIAAFTVCLTRRAQRHSAVAVIALVAALTANAVVGAHRFIAAFVFGNPSTYPHFDELNGTALARGDAAKLNYQQALIRASQAPEPVLQLYQRERRFQLVVTEAVPDPLDCIVGSIKPRENMRLVYERGEVRGEICF